MSARKQKRSSGSHAPENPKHPKMRTRRGVPVWLKLSLVAAVMIIPVMMMSLVLEYQTSKRVSINESIYGDTSYNVGGIMRQSAPLLNPLGSDNALFDALRVQYEEDYGSELTEDVAESYVRNTHLVSTDGTVTLTLDLKKRGLTFIPTYTTDFSAVYLLKNTSEESVAVEFEFPFPGNIREKEITGAKLLVDGVEQENAARTETVTESNYPGYDYGLYKYRDEYPYYEESVPLVTDESESTKTGLYWEGTIDAEETKEIEVRYHTVGLGQFSYEGLENPQGSQDFSFDVIVLGTRKYDNNGILTIDTKEYITQDGINGIVLSWDKPDLFSTPLIDISVAPRVDASEHLYEIYRIMVPLYLAFSFSVIFLVTIMKKEFGGVDMMILAVLFTVFFPFLHYLVSFNVDPSADVLAGYSGVVEFSMPLYGAFAVAFGVVGGMITYLFARVSGIRFALGIILPLIVVYLAFFPLAMTLPEYKYLLALVGVIAILGVFVQLRVGRRITRVETA